MWCHRLVGKKRKPIEIHLWYKIAARGPVLLKTQKNDNILCETVGVTATMGFVLWDEEVQL